MASTTSDLVSGAITGSVPDLSATSRDAAKVKADALVLGVVRTPGGPRLAAGDALPKDLRTRLDAVLEGLGATGAADAVVRVPSGGDVAAPVLALVGLGEAPGEAGTGASDGARSPSRGRRRSRAEAPAAGFDHEVLRRAAGAAVRELAGTASVAVALPAPDVAAAAAVAEGAALGAYAYRRYRSASATSAKEPVRAVQVVTPVAREKALTTALERAAVLGRAVAATRDLVNAPPVDLPPAVFADVARAAVADLPVKVQVLDERALEKGGYGGILGVGKGSSRPPRLVQLSYAPRGARAHVALVGKGITFDSGGLSIKPAKAMETMKCDMAGAAAVLSAVTAAARLGLPVRVTGWLALAENMPSGTAQRPSDVLTTYGGRTVEVLNTDAEGRLVLADALVAACEQGPDAVVDVATLTGAQVVALGTRVSAVMGAEGLRSRVVQAAGAVGEQVWPMPLPEELRASLDSPVADLANIGDRNGGMLVAGVFLQEFVGRVGGAADGPRIPWAHLDIAGPAFNEGAPHDYTPKGGTGAAVRTLVALVEDVAANGAPRP